MSSDSRRTVLGLLALSAGGVVLLLFRPAGPAPLRLVELLGEARVESDRGEYPLFDAERGLSRTLTVSGESRESLTPPFPSRIAFDLRLPPSPSLELAIALVTRQDVSRARVRFSVSIETPEESAVAFERVLSGNDANQWEEVVVSLNRWAEQEVVLVLAAVPVPEREGVLWASRVQTAWGDPAVAEGGSLSAASAAIESWMRARLEGLEPLSRDTIEGSAFLLDCLLAGLLSLGVPLVRRLSPGPSGRSASGLTLFTLATTLIVATVHSSVPLSLGLIGAVSIFRFRAPIPTPRELLDLLLCIGIAVPLGVNRPLLAVAVLVTSIAATAASRLTSRAALGPFRLTASGTCPVGSDRRIVEELSGLSPVLDLESLEIGRGRFQVTARAAFEGTRKTVTALSTLRGRIPDLEITLQTLDGRSG